MSCLFCYIFLFLFEEIKLVISNHFGIVRLKTQSEKYMALKDEISILVSQRFVESCGFSPGTPVSTHKESRQVGLGYKKND